MLCSLEQIYRARYLKMNKFLLRNSSAPKEPFPTSNLEEFWSLTRKFHGSGLTLHVYTIKLRDPSAIQDDPKVNKIVYILKVPLYTSLIN